MITQLTTYRERVITFNENTESEPFFFSIGMVMTVNSLRVPA